MRSRIHIITSVSLQSFSFRRVISGAPTSARFRALRAATAVFIRGGGSMLTEFQKQKLPRLFALHDLNRDGVINRADFEDYARMIASTRGWGTDSAEYVELFGRFLRFWDGLEQVAKSRGARHVTL